MSLGQRSRSKTALNLCAKASVIHVRVRPITLSRIKRFENKLIQMITVTRGCFENENHIALSKFKVTVYTLTLCIGFSETCLCPTCDFVMHGGI